MAQRSGGPEDPSHPVELTEPEGQARVIGTYTRYRLGQEVLVGPLLVWVLAASCEVAEATSTLCKGERSGRPGRLVSGARSYCETTNKRGEATTARLAQQAKPGTAIESSLQ